KALNMKKQNIIPYMEKIMHERGKRAFQPSWFPKDDDQEETFDSLCDLYAEGKITMKGGYYFDLIFIL
ncbi:hypothetical protein, partial [Salmonella enterica]